MEPNAVQATTGYAMQRAEMGCDRLIRSTSGEFDFLETNSRIAIGRETETKVQHCRDSIPRAYDTLTSGCAFMTCSVDQNAEFCQQLVVRHD